MEVEGMVTGSPSDIALVRAVRVLIRIALNAGLHDVAVEGGGGRE